MEITTKFNIDETVFYLQRESISEQCLSCNGKKIINVTNGVENWNIKCPTCNGKGKKHNIIRYSITNGIVKGVIAKCDAHPSIKYILDNGFHKQETALFSNMEEAEKKCFFLNEQIKQRM